MDKRRIVSARNLSYASSVRSRSGRAVVRVLENSTGRLRLIRRGRGYADDLAQGTPFFDVMALRYGVHPELMAGSLDLIPRTGPVIFIANHPYGILDGLMLCHLMSRTRGDFRIMANDIFEGASEVSRHLLPISFAADRAALARNLATRRTALDYLGQGGAIGIFPGGTVSTGARPFAQPLDPIWRSFTARMIAKSRATVVPVFFEGHTSRMFQIASHLHPTLRLGLLMREFRKRVDTPVRLAIGDPIGRDQLDPLAGDAKAMMDFLRKATYDLSPEPMPSGALGLEFEQHHRAGKG